MDLPAAHRRRHDVAPAHRRADRARLHPPHRARAGRLARGGRGVGAARPRAQGDARHRQPRAAGPACARSTSSATKTPLLPYRKALAHRTPIEWRSEDLPDARRSPAPGWSRRRSRTCAPFIDWTFFFTAWELKGTYPAILDHPAHGAAARELFEHAQELLDQIERDGSLQARGVYGFWPANAEGDDIVLDNGVTFPMLRQQIAARTTTGPTAPWRTSWPRPSPASRPPRRVRRHRGHRRRRAREGVRGRARRLPRHHGQGPRRPAGRGVRRVRCTSRRGIAWGYQERRRSPTTSSSRERYRGIRPAFGYPACPDHSLKRRLFDLLGARAIRASSSPRRAR